ncbi:MAG: hypothetical protein IPH88_05655 [Bacteroidales bacterium]|nr:hypothetical protein [Bacteroidales bacterium]
MHRIRYTALLLLLLGMLEAIAQNEIKIGFLSPEKKEILQAERKAAFDALQTLGTSKSEVVPMSKISKKTPNPSEFRILCYHRPDSSTFTETESGKDLANSLRSYVEAGGNLLLTLDALRLLPGLGLESAEPRGNTVMAVDEGYGRKIGIHSYLSHPVFDSLFGGAYLYAPNTDVPCRRMGWFGNELPNGKTIAVDWAYIHLIESSKLVVEYTIGKGKVLAIGAYTIFGPENLNKQVTELFLRNCLRYLSGSSKNAEHYWDYSTRRIDPLESRGYSALVSQSMDWLPPTDSHLLRKSISSSQPWDVATERIVAMGKEEGGIEEVWTHPFLAIRDFEASIRFEGSNKLIQLSSLRPETEVRPESLKRIYRFPRGYLEETVCCHPTEPGLVVHYEYNGIPSASLILQMKSNLRLMWPYSENVTGSLQFSWEPLLNAFIFNNSSASMSVVAGTNKVPTQYIAGPYSSFHQSTAISGTEGSAFIMVGDSSQNHEIGALYSFDLSPHDRMDFVLAATSAGIDDAVEKYVQLIFKPISVQLLSMRTESAFLDRSLQITTPDPEFNLGYDWAKLGTNRFMVNTPGIGTSLVAGYSTTATGWDGGHKVNGRPGYAWYFGRDGVWSSYAMLDYGEFEKVKLALETYIRFQDIRGKIYHELTTSGVAHYDAADATPLFISLAGRYLRHSGDEAFIKKNWDAIKKAIDFCYSTDTDNDGLIENTLVGHGWEEGGALFGTHTTLYLASCWAEALKQAAYMAGNTGHSEEARKFAHDEGKVLQLINTEFWNPETQFFFHGKYKDNSFHPEPGVMAAVPVYFGQVNDQSKSTSVLKTLAGSSFSSDWGVRIIGDNSSFYNPGSYHQGSVWPLFTGWTSLAEYEDERPVQGFSHIMNNLLTYRKWASGFVPEVLHGNIYQPFGVCFHQCWSESMVVQPAIEGMLGLKMDAVRKSISLYPQFPADWDSIRVNNIRMGNSYIDLKMLRSKEKTSWTFVSKGDPGNAINLSLKIPLLPGSAISRVFVNGKEYEAEKQKNYIGMNLNIPQKGKVDTIVVETVGTAGICALPAIDDPKPGNISLGVKIISQEFSGNTFSLTLSGRSGSDVSFRIYSPKGPGILPDGCKLLDHRGDIYTIGAHLPPADSKYFTLKLQFILP